MGPRLRGDDLERFNASESFMHHGVQWPQAKLKFQWQRPIGLTKSAPQSFIRSEAEKYF